MMQRLSLLCRASPDIAPVSTTSAASVTPTVPLQAGLPALPPTRVDPVYGAAQMYGYDRGGRKHAGQDFDAGPNDFFYLESVAKSCVFSMILVGMVTMLTSITLS